MKNNRFCIFVVALACGFGRAAAAQPARIGIVAAENFYGDIARQIGGADVAVTSILTNPDQDPHLFEASASGARAVSQARIVIYSGIDYDPWMEKILAAAGGRDRTAINVADLTGHKPGDNPHVWYATTTMRALARRLEAVLAADDPVHGKSYEARLATFAQSLRPIDARIATLRARLAGTKVAATEPILGYLLQALGLDVRDQSFQRAVMNDTEPSASDIAAFEHDLTTRTVRLLIYNSQATDPTAERMRRIAGQAGVAVVGATETEPAGEHYQDWMLSALAALDAALPAARP